MTPSKCFDLTYPFYSSNEKSFRGVETSLFSGVESSQDLFHLAHPLHLEEGFYLEEKPFFNNLLEDLFLFKEVVGWLKHALCLEFII